MKDHLHIRELINRLARLDAASAWDGDLNPTQRAVLDYLGRANRFSRSPSHVADFLGSTRGTISQSIKSLLMKGYVSEHRSTLDKRAISFALTEKGKAIVQRGDELAQSVTNLDEREQQALLTLLTRLLRDQLAKNNGRAFGMCNTCAHFEAAATGGFCKLLSEKLSPEETLQICHEQRSA